MFSILLLFGEIFFEFQKVREQSDVFVMLFTLVQDAETSSLDVAGTMH